MSYLQMLIMLSQSVSVNLCMSLPVSSFFDCILLIVPYRQLSTSTISSKRLTMDVNLYPEPPAADMIDMRVKERQQQAIMREKNEKIDAILQRRK